MEAFSQLEEILATIRSEWFDQDDEKTFDEAYCNYLHSK